MIATGETVAEGIIDNTCLTYREIHYLVWLNKIYGIT